MQPIVIDLSHHNTIPQSLQAAKAAGIVGVIHKATEGTSHIDSKMAARYSLAKDAGLLWGVYHFLRPGDMEAQAEWFVNNAVQDDNTCYVADYEVGGISVDELIVFLETVEELTGRVALIYSGHTLKDALAGEADHRLDKYALWLAQYGPAPELPPGFAEYWLWQYTDEGTCPGVNPPTDLNVGGFPTSLIMDKWAGWPEDDEPDEDVVAPTVMLRVTSDKPVNLNIEIDTDMVSVNMFPKEK